MAGEYPHECGLCGYKFETAKDLEAHVLDGCPELR